MNEVLKKLKQDERKREVYLCQKRSAFLFPMYYNDVFEMYKKARASFWTPEEICMDGDKWDFETLPSAEQKFFKHILAFFVASEITVAENIIRNFLATIEMIEAQNFYSLQLTVENIHSEIYQLLLENIIVDRDEIDKLRETTNLAEIKAKNTWLNKYMSKKLPLAVQLMGSIITEGVFFSGSFAAVQMLREKNKLSGFTKSNEYIRRDEFLHLLFGLLIYKKYLVEKLPSEIVEEMFAEAERIEIAFFTAIISSDLTITTLDDMIRFIKYTCARLKAHILDSDSTTTTTPLPSNPYPYLDDLFKDNFLEARSTAYNTSNENTQLVEKTFF